MSSSSCPFHTCLSLCMYKCVFMEVCICVEHQRTQISGVILRKIINCLETVLLQGLSLSWNSVRRTGWPASGLSDSPVSTFSALGLAVCATTPGMLIWGSGNEAQALMLARQAFLPAAPSTSSGTQSPKLCNGGIMHCPHSPGVAEIGEKKVLPVSWRESTGGLVLPPKALCTVSAAKQLPGKPALCLMSQAVRPLALPSPREIDA